ncbi:MAG: hypothetical protein BAJATHORv1_70026 [Candidatus Thorarchaeota archaeon]|nr:MAG: hypothetical protein BAJATHORv1_70026 [Candidatus Thorarchaeota archaeon]
MPIKTLSRRPFALMLEDDSGEIVPVKLDPAMVTSDRALIVLDEFNDTCWVWIGRNVNMPTRMHALRMGKGIQKSGHTIGVTTIGMATTHLVEMMEKDAGDPEVAGNIERFKTAIDQKWTYEDEVLATLSDGSGPTAPPPESSSASYEATPAISESPPPSPEPEPVSTRPPKPPRKEPEPLRETVTTPTGSVGVEQKAAYLLYATVSNAELVYTERINRDGKTGFKIEAPGIFVVEAILDGDDLSIKPSNFGDNEEARKIKAEYESMIKKL